MFFNGVSKRFLVITAPSDGFAPLDAIWTADVVYSSSYALYMVSALIPARLDEVCLALRLLTYLNFLLTT